jgi:hypothetical protein
MLQIDLGDKKVYYRPNYQTNFFALSSLSHQIFSSLRFLIFNAFQFKNLKDANAKRSLIKI